MTVGSSPSTTAGLTTASPTASSLSRWPSLEMALISTSSPPKPSAQGAAFMDAAVGPSFACIWHRQAAIPLSPPPPARRWPRPPSTALSSFVQPSPPSSCLSSLPLPAAQASHHPSSSQPIAGHSRPEPKPAGHRTSPTHGRCSPLILANYRPLTHRPPPPSSTKLPPAPPFHAIHHPLEMSPIGHVHLPLEPPAATSSFLAEPPSPSQEEAGHPSFPIHLPTAMASKLPRS